MTLSMRIHIVSSNIPLALMLAVMSSPLRAAPEDTVQAYVSTSITHDDNLLRISSDVDPMTVSGQPSVADTISQAMLGLKLDWKQGRQEVIVDASVSETRFSRFATLNYRGTNLKSRWNWQLGNSLSGNVGYNRATTLGSFAEQQRLTSNLNTQQNEFAEGAWQVSPGTRLDGGLTHGTYQDTANSASRYRFMRYTAGAYLTPPSGNEVGIMAVRLTQKYPVRETFSGVPVDNGFNQNQLLATVNWLHSGHLRVKGQAGIVDRAHNQLSERDFSGKTMRGTLTWLASGKGMLDLTAWNEVDGYDNLTTSYTQTKGISLEPTWSPTGKLSVSARLQHLKRDFLGNPSLKLFPGSLTPVRQDTLNTASLSVNYQPVRTLNISTSVQKERRSSNQSSAAYSDNTISLNMSFSF